MIYVIGIDRMCFWVDDKTLEPTNVSCYDAFAFLDPHEPHISINEWNRRRECLHKHD